MTKRHDYTLMRTLVMVGMMGCGKSAVGAAVADSLNAPFADSDREVEGLAGMSIPLIFEEKGEHEFRLLETKALIRLLDGKRRVLAAGGGLYLSPRNRELIEAKAVSVWLNADIDVLWSRVRRKATRPLLLTSDPYATLKELLEERTRYYSTARVSVDICPEHSVAETANRVLEQLANFEGSHKILAPRAGNEN